MTPKENRVSVIVGGLFTLFGLAGLADSTLFARKAEQATATVVSSVLVSSGKYSRFDVTVRFRTEDGTPVQTVLTSESPRETPNTPGHTLDILYQTDNPGRVRRHTFAGMWGVYTGLALFGVLVAAMSYIPTTDGRKPRRRGRRSRG